MKELTIEHLAAYLPYRVGVKVLDYKSDYVGNQFDMVVGIEQWDKTGSRWSVITKGGSKPSPDRVKPILRPPSDLTREITHNGEAFVPMERVMRDHEAACLYYASLDSHQSWYIPYALMKDMLSWHFDLFDLGADNLCVYMNPDGTLPK